MTQNGVNNMSVFDFKEIRDRYERFSKVSTGFKAQLGKRISSPKDLSFIPAFYKLFPSVNPTDWHYRVAFIVPYIRYSDEGPTLGGFLGLQDRHNKGNLEKRVLQIVRANHVNNLDVIYLRRLLMRFDIPAINWNKSNLQQFFSIDDHKNSNGKKTFIEQYFVAREYAEKEE